MDLLMHQTTPNQLQLNNGVQSENQLNKLLQWHWVKM